VKGDNMKGNKTSQLLMQMGRSILKEPGIDFFLESVEELAAAVTALVLQVDFNWSGMGNWDHRDLRQQRESA
jgi:hypothetical protein